MGFGLRKAIYKGVSEVRLRSAYQLVIMVVFFWGLGFVEASPGVTYHGRLLKPDGKPVVSSNVQFRLQVRTPLPSNCLMYEEIHTEDLSASVGSFSITLNQGASTPNMEPFTLVEAFQNRGEFTFSATKCTGDNEYAPNSSDGRRLLVFFNDGSFAGWEPLPAQDIAFVPMAIESITVGGHKPGNFFRVENGGVPQVLSPWSPASYQKLTDLVGNTTISGGNASIGGNAAGFTGSLSGDVTGGQSSTKVEKIQGRDVLDSAPTNGQVLTWNHANSRWEATNLPAAGAPAWNDITGKPSEFPAGGSAGGDLSGNYPNPEIAANAVTGTEIADGAVSPSKLTNGSATGQVLRYNTGSGWAATKLNFMDLVNSIGASPWPTGTCVAGEAIVWESISDGFKCQAISFTETDPKVGANTTNMLSKWNGTALVASGVYENGGNVGIGTTNPVFPLTVVRGGNLGFISVEGVSATDQAGLKLGPNGAAKMLLRDRFANGTNNFSIYDQQTNQDQFFINPSGKVGIGTTNPVYSLDVQSSVAAGNGIQFTNMDMSPGAISVFQLKNGSLETLGLYQYSSTLGPGGGAYQPDGGLLVETGTGGLSLGTSSVSPIRFYTGGMGNANERMRIDTSGKIGIGTASPAGALDIQSTTGAFIPPRMTTAERNALSSPPNGSVIYNITDNKMNFRENGSWVQLGSAGGSIPTYFKCTNAQSDNNGVGDDPQCVAAAQALVSGSTDTNYSMIRCRRNSDNLPQQGFFEWNGTTWRVYNTAWVNCADGSAVFLYHP